MADWYVHLNGVNVEQTECDMTSPDIYHANLFVGGDILRPGALAEQGRLLLGIDQAWHSRNSGDRCSRISKCTMYTACQQNQLHVVPKIPIRRASTESHATPMICSLHMEPNLKPHRSRIYNYSMVDLKCKYQTCTWPQWQRPASIATTQSTRQWQTAKPTVLNARSSAA
jgi:hypothetical protein